MYGVISRMYSRAKHRSEVFWGVQGIMVYEMEISGT